MKLLRKYNQFLFVVIAIVFALLIALFHTAESYQKNDIWIQVVDILHYHVTESQYLLNSAEVTVDWQKKLAIAEQHIKESKKMVSLLLKGGNYRDARVKEVVSPNVRVTLSGMKEEFQIWETLLQEAMKESYRDEPLLHRLLSTGANIELASRNIRRVIHEEIESISTFYDAGKTLITALLLLSIIVVVALTRRTTSTIEQKNSEIKDALSKLKAQREAFDNHSIIAVTDINGVITDVNDKFCEISGYQREELIGNTHKVVNSSFHSEKFFKDMWETIKKGRVWHGEVLNRSKSGKPYWVETTIYPYKDEKGAVNSYIAIRTDITDRKHYETELAEAEIRIRRESKALQRIAMRDRSQIVDITSNISFVTETVANTINASRVSVWIVSENRDSLECIDIFDVLSRSHSTTESLDLERIKYLSSVLENEQLIEADAENHDPFYRELRDAGITSSDVETLVIASIINSDYLIGFLCIEQAGQTRKWRLDESSFCTSVAEYLSELVDTINRNRIEAALRVIAKTAKSQDDIFRDIAYQISRGLKADFVSIGQITSSGNKVKTLAVWRQNQFVENFTYNYVDSICDDVVIQSTDELAHMPASIMPASDDDAQKKGSYISAPLYNSEQEIIGGIIVMGAMAIHNLGLAGYMLRLCGARASAEIERIKTQARLTSIVSGMSDFIWETDQGGKITYCTRKVMPILGYSVEEIVGKNITEFIGEEDVQSGGRQFMELVSMGSEIRNAEILIKGIDGNDVCLLSNAVPIFDDEDELTGYRIINTDITKRKESEIKTKLLATAIDQSEDGVLIADISGMVEYANPAYLNITGMKSDDVVGVDIERCGVVEIDSEFKTTLLEKFKLGEGWAGRGQNRTRQGAHFEQEVILTPIYSEKKELLKVVIGIRDITKEQLIERKTIQAQKMEAIGTLAGGIAHDFNNILSAILGYAHLTKEDLPRESELQENIDQVIMAAGRAKNLVQQILAFSRQTATELQVLSPGTMTNEVLKLLRASISTMINIHTNINAKDTYICMDPSHYHQIIMNLVVNASHAIGEGQGDIFVELKPCTVSQDDPEIEPGKYVRLSVTDTGCGMNDEVKARAFEPFFTTKSVDEGTGMGLSAVHGIVSAANGHIRVDSEEAKGTKIEVYLPISVIEQEPEVHREITHRQGKEHILIIDDEDIQTSLMRLMLTRNGYKVTTCNDSGDALKLFAERKDEFDAVITDQNMPNMTGDRLAMALLKLKPDLPIVMCTGYSKNIGPEEAKAIGIRAYVMKPIAAEELNEVVAEIFESPVNGDNP